MKSTRGERRGLSTDGHRWPQIGIFEGGHEGGTKNTKKKRREII
jgi:hypothetical protein